MDSVKVLKMIGKIDSLVTLLKSHQIFHIHRNISQFDYMEKKVELLELITEFEVVQKRAEKIQGWIDTKYLEVFEQWKTDMSWLRKNRDIVEGL